MKKAFGLIIATLVSLTFQSQLMAKTLPYGDIAGVSTIFPTSSFIESSLDGQTTKISLVFTLLGCVDKLGDVVHFAQVEDGQLHLYVAGQNIASEASKVVRCIVAPTAARAIEVEGNYAQEDIVIHNLSVTKAIKKAAVDGAFTCTAYWTGYELNEASGTCQKSGRSGCGNPFEFQNMDSCKEAYGLK